MGLLPIVYVVEVPKPGETNGAMLQGSGRKSPIWLCKPVDSSGCNLGKFLLGFFLDWRDLEGPNTSKHVKTERPKGEMIGPSALHASPRRALPHAAGESLSCNSPRRR